MTNIKRIQPQPVSKRGKSGVSALLDSLSEQVELTPQEEAMAKALEEGDLETVSREGSEALSALRDLANTPEGKDIAATASETARALLDE